LATPHTPLIDWAKVTEWLGKSWRWVTAVFLASLLALILPETLLNRVGLCDLVQNYKGILAVSCVLTGFVLLTYVGSGLRQWIAPHFADWRVIHRGRKHLHHLGNDEKQHCQWFLDTNGNSLHHNEANGALGSLVEKNILFTPGQPWGNGMRDFRIRPWALKYLKEHPELLS